MKHNALIVDDVVFSVDVLKHFLKPYEVRASYVTSGAEAVNLIREEKLVFHAVFVDQMMPDMDGIETARAIRALGTEYAGTIPLIAMTANADLGDRASFLCRGFQDFISKPIDISQLESVIHRWIIKTDKAVFPAEPQQRETAEFFNLQIDGIDIKRCPKHFGWDGIIFIEFLRSFTKNIPKLIETARNETENMKNYAIYIHGIKGSCRNICAEELSNEAEALEKAAKAGDYDFVFANSHGFLAKAEKLIENINETLKN
jgi:CheY-like chemotaxis protein